MALSAMKESEAILKKIYDQGQSEHKVLLQSSAGFL